MKIKEFSEYTDVELKKALEKLYKQRQDFIEEIDKKFAEKELEYKLRDEALLSIWKSVI